MAPIGQVKSVGLGCNGIFVVGATTNQARVVDLLLLLLSPPLLLLVDRGCNGIFVVGATTNQARC